MERLGFGITLAIVGMGGTLLSLFLISLAIMGFSRLLGPSNEKKEEGR